MKTLLFILLTLTGLNGFAQEVPTDCKDLQTGYFAYTEEPQDRFLIKRTAKKQYELGVVSKDKIELKIYWDGCKYDLEYLKTNDPELKHFEGVNMEVKIVSREGDTYQYESFALGQKFEGEIKRVDKKEHIAYVKKKYGK